MNEKIKDPLGERLKLNYENRTRYYLPRRTYTIIRLDGKSFHNYTRNLHKPFAKHLYEDIDNAILNSIREIQGAVFAYTQSDEISILLTDFATNQTCAWFDGNIQKMVSVASSIFTAEFNRIRYLREANLKSLTGNLWLRGPDAINRVPPAYFDARIFTIPDRIEVMNYFRWRQQDCVRNSVSMVAQSKFSHKELHGKNQSDMHEMLHNIGVNWATDYTDGEKNGRIIMKEKIVGVTPDGDPCERSKWAANDAWVFTKDEGKLLNMIPNYE